MTPDIPVTQELLHALPKTDLHCHLDGSLRLRTMLELAEQQGVRLPADSEAGLAKAMKIGQRHGSLEEYLKGFEITLSVLQTEDGDLYRGTREIFAHLRERDPWQFAAAHRRRFGDHRDARESDAPGQLVEYFRGSAELEAVA